MRPRVLREAEDELAVASESFSPAACGGSTPGTSARAKRPLIGIAELISSRAFQPGIHTSGGNAQSRLDFPFTATL